MGKTINHLNVLNDTSRIYCRKNNKVVFLGNHWDECFQCNMFRGSCQGEGVECEWFDEDEEEPYPVWVRDPWKGYRRLNPF